MHDRSVTRPVGVYDVDGGLLGEAAYVWGKVRGTRHCALCDITHGRVRRRPEWDRMVVDLGTPPGPVAPERDAAGLAQVVAGCGAPVVVARTAQRLSAISGRRRARRAGGSVARLGDLLRARLAADRA